jgi:hypothetical protein
VPSYTHEAFFCRIPPESSARANKSQKTETSNSPSHQYIKQPCCASQAHLSIGKWQLTDWWIALTPLFLQSESTSKVCKFRCSRFVKCTSTPPFTHCLKFALYVLKCFLPIALGAYSQCSNSMTGLPLCFLSKCFLWNHYFYCRTYVHEAKMWFYDQNIFQLMFKHVM